MTTFDKAFDLLVGHEGGYVNHPSDPGGETKFGISRRAFPSVDIKGLTLEDAKRIYASHYWDPIRGNDLPPMVAYVVFDAAVNSGTRQAGKWLQTAVKVAADGAIGPATIKAVTTRSPEEVVAEFNAQRMVFMTNLGTWKTFGLGWARRLSKLPIEAVKHFGTP